MGIFDVFKSKWNNSDQTIRLAAVKQITDKKELMKVAQTCTYEDAGLRAVELIDSQSDLLAVADSAAHEAVALMALGKIVDNHCAAEVFKTTTFRTVKAEALKRIGESQAFMALVMSVTDSELGNDFKKNPEELLKNINEEKDLATIVRCAASGAVRMAALKKIHDETLCIYVAKTDSETIVRMEAVKGITNELALLDIIKSDSQFGVKVAVIARLKECVKNISILEEFAGHIQDEEIKKLLDKVIADRPFLDIGEQFVTGKAGFDNMAWHTDDQAILEVIAVKGASASNREKAVSKINNQALLAKIVKSDKDIIVRIAALKKLQDQSVIIDIFKSDSDKHVRAVAAGLISDQKTLVDIFFNNTEIMIKINVLDKIADLESLARIAKSDAGLGLLMHALSKVSDKSLLADIEKTASSEVVRKAAAVSQQSPAEILKAAQSAEAPNVRAHAVSLLQDKAAIEQIARSKEAPIVRSTAREKIEDPALLLELFKSEEDEYSRAGIVGRLSDDKALLEIAKTDQSQYVRDTALNQIKDQGILEDILLKESNPALSDKIVQKVRDQQVLCEWFMKQSANFLLCSDVLKFITDEELLEKIAQSHSHTLMKKQAEQWLETIKQFKTMTAKQAEQAVKPNPANGLFSGFTPEQLNVLAQKKSDIVFALTSSNAEIVSLDFSDQEKNLIRSLSKQQADELVVIQTTLEQGVKEAEKNNFTQAITILEGCIARAPWHFIAIKTMGSCYFYLDKLDMSLDYMKKAYALNRYDIKIIDNLLQIQDKMKQAIIANMRVKLANKDGIA